MRFLLCCRLRNSLIEAEGEGLTLRRRAVAHQQMRDRSFFRGRSLTLHPHAHPPPQDRGYRPFTVRVDKNRSSPPKPPLPFEAKTIVRPSCERTMCRSLPVELSSGKCTGVDHGSCTLLRVEVKKSVSPKV